MEPTFKKAKREPHPPGDIICGLVAFREVGRVFQIITRIGEETYDFEADSILLNHKAFVDGIWHLHNKYWMSGQHFADLLTCISEVIYREWGQRASDSFGVSGTFQKNPDK